MSQSQNKGCGCGNIPISVILLLLGGSFWAVRKYGLPNVNLSQINSVLAKVPGIKIQIPVEEPPVPTAPPTPTPTLPPGLVATPPPAVEATPEVAQPAIAPAVNNKPDEPLPKTDWEKNRFAVSISAAIKLLIMLANKQFAIALNTISLRELIRLFTVYGVMPVRCIEAR